MFSLFPIFFFCNPLFPPGKDPGGTDTLALTILPLGPCVGSVPLGWRPPKVDSLIPARVPRGSLSYFLTLSLGNLGDPTWSNYLMDFAWMRARYTLSFVMHSLMCRKELLKTVILPCPHKSKALGGNHERRQFSPHSANAEHYNIHEAPIGL